MPFISKSPSIKLIISKDLYNNLINSLELALNIEILSRKADNLKSKMLAFSMPKYVNDKEYVDIRLFPSEAGELINILLIYLPKSSSDSFSLIVDRENKK